MGTELHQGDCLSVLPQLAINSVNLVYLDPPFFTGRIHHSSTRDGATRYRFSDIWNDPESYIGYLKERLEACKSVMRTDASVFVHCDHNNVHLAREALDLTFGSENFQSEIIWSYKRWSNSKRGLLQQHQTILFYSKSAEFKWRPVTVDYSATTNVDQILQRRARDTRGKSVYATDADGNIVFGVEKRGVPLGDVWEIPFLNPKAKERVGYPTQKPLILLERIIELTTDEGDVVLDPFCGSGTTLVAAKLKRRTGIGIDISPEAVALTRSRLEAPVRTESALLNKGIQAYENNDPWVEAHLRGLAYSRVQRNSGIDAILKETSAGKQVLIRVQREGEALSEAVFALKRAVSSKGSCLGCVIATGFDLFRLNETDIHIVESPALKIRELLKPDPTATTEVVANRAIR
jgi:site-specific DNA-methyltransferase (adenine-specific)